MRETTNLHSDEIRREAVFTPSRQSEKAEEEAA